MVTNARAIIEARLARETGTLFGQGRRSLALVHPTPYGVGMSSLGFQSVYRLLNELPDTRAERGFLPGPGEAAGEPLLTYESRRPVGDHDVVAFSVAWELEISGVVTCLERAGISPLARDRGEGDPWVIAGGPLTFSSPAPLAPFADVIVVGEAEGVLAGLVDMLLSGGSRAELLGLLAERPGLYVPSLHGGDPPPLARCNDASLPAVSTIWTEETTFSNMALVETSRGCSRGCSFCVMSRRAGGGMRVVPVERILAAIPRGAPRVGLVGAAVTDHPHIEEIVRAVVDSGREVGLSSLRADRLTPELGELLRRGGYRTLTVASDGASQRLRDAMDKRIREEHLMRAAALACELGLRQLKIYVMLGLPGEQPADLEELVALSLAQAHAASPRTRVVLAVSPFVPKRNTPLYDAPFAGIREVERRIEVVRRALAPRVQVRASSARWAWVEAVLARGGPEAGMAVLEATRAGGDFAAYRRAFNRARLGA